MDFSEENIEVSAEEAEALQDEEHEEDVVLNETKSEKAMRLAVARMNKYLQACSQLQKLTNKSSYEFTEEQIEKLASTIETSAAETATKFREMYAKSNGGNNGFSF